MPQHGLWLLCLTAGRAVLGAATELPPIGFDRPRAGGLPGTVESISYPSRSVGTNRQAVVYRPPGYSATQRYPVLYLLPGIGQVETAWTAEGSAHQIVDNLLREGRCEPLIVVMANGRASATTPPRNPFEGDPLQTYGAFEADLLGDLIPFVEAHYAARTDRDGRALAGLSMGGGQALNIGLKHPEQFAWVAAFSAAPNTKPVVESVADPAALAATMRLVWISCGDRDALQFVSRTVHDNLVQLAVPHAWHLNPGRGHDWPAWRADLWSLLQVLFQPGSAALATPPELPPSARRETPPLRVVGRELQDPSGRPVVLRGTMQPGASWFNGEGRNFAMPQDYRDPASVAPAVRYYRAVADLLTDATPRYGRRHGWLCRFVRFIGDGSAPHNCAPGWDAAGELARPDQFAGWLDQVVVPYVEHCRQRGLYVVLVGNPAVAFARGADGQPDPERNMSQQYQRNLRRFWTLVAHQPRIRNAPQVHFEICNEPIRIESSFGAGDWGMGTEPYHRAMTAFMQPVVDAIRETGAGNVIWVPGLGWQGEAAGFAKFPVRGDNIGYAAHWYPAYGGAYDDVAQVQRLWRSNYQPVAAVAPLLISEMFWTPNAGRGYENLWNAHTAGFGNAARACLEEAGNVSFVIGMVGDLLSNLRGGLADSGLGGSEAVQAAFDWFAQDSERGP